MVVIKFFTALFEEIVLFFSKPLGFGTHFSTGNLIIWSIYIGIIGAALICLYNGVFLGRYVKHLLKNEARSSDKAISPFDAGYKNIFLKRALKNSTAFKKIVISDDNDESDVLKKHYYISEGNGERAKNLYAQNGANPIFIIIIAIVLLVLVAFLYYVLPSLIDMTKNFLGSFKTPDNIA